MSKYTYPWGMDCAWIASDSDGNLAAFITAGEGPIPVQLFNNDGFCVEEVGDRVCDLPVLSDVNILDSTKRPDDFVKLASRGFFVFDWTDVYRTESSSIDAYEKVAMPIKPLPIAALPQELANIASRVNFQDVKFSDISWLNIRAYAKCRE